MSHGATPGSGLPEEKMPGHWLLARMGKRVLRPGGLELTHRLLDNLAITSDDEVVEFAPGLGVTTRMALSCQPRSYTAIERDQAAARGVSQLLTGPRQSCVVGTAQESGLQPGSATVVFGEAMLSMQPRSTKASIAGEAARLLKPGGRYGIHELCLIPDDVDNSVRDAIQHDLTDEIHVGVRPLTQQEWRELLTEVGLTVTAEETAPMHLLEPARVVKDEGLIRAARFVFNVATHSGARKRVLQMRRVFRKYSDHLAAYAAVARKNKDR